MLPMGHSAAGEGQVSGKAIANKKPEVKARTPLLVKLKAGVDLQCGILLLH